jgi:hypothetical protein
MARAQKNRFCVVETALEAMAGILTCSYRPLYRLPNYYAVPAGAPTADTRMEKRAGRALFRAGRVNGAVMIVAEIWAR